MADARAVLKEQAASGLSMNAFAAREGIDAWRLYRWRQRLDAEKRVLVDAPKQARKKERKKTPVSAKPRANAEPTTPAVIELRAAHTSSNIEIVLPSGLVVRVSETIDTAAVARLISVLRQ
jgi:hypothetical protein